MVGSARGGRVDVGSVVGAVAAPSAVLIRPDGHVAWVGERTQEGLRDELIRWFGPPAAAG